MKFTIAPLIALAMSSTSLAAPLEARDVWAPPVLYPHSGTVWIIGQHHNVTWDASNPPALISNRASISLVKGGGLLSTGPGSYADPMASDFDLRTGRQVVQVPAVEQGEYQIVLFGDSGNWGELFTITN